MVEVHLPSCFHYIPHSEHFYAITSIASHIAITLFFHLSKLPIQNSFLPIPENVHWPLLLFLASLLQFLQPFFLQYHCLVHPTNMGTLKLIATQFK